MADWFETRFPERTEPTPLDPAFAARVRELVVEEWHADTRPSAPDETTTDDREGDIIMLETDDHVTGDQPAPPRRRLPGRWLLAAASVAIVALVGALLAGAGDGDGNELDTLASEPATDGAPAPAAPRPVPDMPRFVDLEPGIYYIDPDGDEATPLTVTFEVAAEGWSSWFGAAKFDGNDQLSLSITTITDIVRDACHDHSPADPPVGPTVDDLATALSRLAPFEVTSPPSDVTLFGYRGKHLALTVPDIATSGEEFTDCTAGNLASWFSPLQDGSFYGYNTEPGRIEDFWILDVDGTRLVIETTRGPDSDPENLAELDAIFDSIRIVR